MRRASACMVILLTVACATAKRGDLADAGGGGGPDAPGGGGPDAKNVPDAAPGCADTVCDPNATCSVGPSGPTCTCDPGYMGDGHTCNDVNECTMAGACDANAACTNSAGGYTCTCNAGFVGDGHACADVNECATPGICDANATCTNTPGGYSCACIPPYSGDGHTCTYVATPIAFPSAGDTHYSLYGGPMWNSGDYVEGTRSAIASTTSATLHLVISANGLTCDNQDMTAMLNGIPIGNFSITPGATVLDLSFPYGAITGPTYVIRYQTNRTVSSGCGAADLAQGTGSTITLN